MATLEIKQCILTNNGCYKKGATMIPKGIVVHSTGINNPFLKRYVQPDDGILGDNVYNNDWNRGDIAKCVHAMIGKDKDGNVRVYQLLPWDYKPWGCGKGKKGTYNDDYIQFEICEDALTDEKYFNEAFALAAELCAYLAKMYNIPIKNIVSHKEAHKLGYASNHGDCDHWLKKFSKNMKWFRNEVNNIINPVTKKPTYTGYLDNATTSAINGWAWNSIDDTALTVKIKIYKNNIITLKTLETIANIYRSDLKSAGKGNGKHGFNLEFDFNTLGAGTYTVRAFAGGKLLYNKKTVVVKAVATVKYFKKYTGNTTSISEALKSIGEQYSYTYRTKIAKANGIKAYVGLGTQNTKMLNLLKQGKLIKP